MDEPDLDYIEQRLPQVPPSRLHERTVEGGALIVPTHVAVVRHAAWRREWASGATWGNNTRWANEVPLGLVSEGQIRLDVARALATHNASELADLAAHPGWEWVANVMPPMSGDPATASVPPGGDFGDHEGERRPSIPDLDGGQPQASGSPNTGTTPNAGASSQQEGLRVKVVPPEASNVLEYRTTPTAGEGARRSESLLVKEFERWLAMKGHEVGRAQIRPVGENAPLVTDTYDVTDSVLYEAKSSADRATIRLGVGQLLDYLRFLPGVKGSLLLPSDPSYDLRLFIFSCGFSVTYRQGSSWVTDES